MASIVETQNSGQEQQREQERQQAQQQLTRSHLVAKLLAAGPDIREFMHNLLHVQAIVVNGTEAAGFLLQPDPQQQSVQLHNVSHIRPDQSDEETRKAAAAFKAYYAKVPGKSGAADDYTMDHTAAFYLFDTQGEARVLAKHDASAGDLTHDIRILLKR